jgi:hypothetical protein
MDAELRFALSQSTTAVSRARAALAQPTQRLNDALASPRVDENYIRNLRAQIERAQLDLQHAEQRHQALADQGDTPEEISAAKSESTSLVARVQPEPAAMMEAWSRLIPPLMEAVAAAREVHAHNVTIRQISTRVVQLNHDFNLHTEPPPAPPTPPLAEIKLVMAAGELLMQFASRQLCDDAPYLHALAELHATASVPA